MTSGMQQRLIEFRLRALSEIQPWGVPDDPNLSWFGLSDGNWWIKVGDLRLFEYSSAMRALGAPHYCDYQIVRLHEDLMHLVPYALEDIPTELAQWIALDGRASWSARWEKWMTALPNEHLSDDDFKLIDLAGSWIGRRSLDSLYLRPSFDLRIWASEGQIHLDWDNRNRIVEGACAWTAVVGSYVVPVGEFASAIREFQESFIEQMSIRVEEVRRGALRDRNIRVDIEAVARDQVNRAKEVREHALAHEHKTDWSAVLNAISKLEERVRC
jgi:hypothetical protein